MNKVDWLTQTLASEIMVSDVITLGCDDLIADAAAVLLREQITGAPVVDEGGICVGVLSASDIIGAEARVERERIRIAEDSFWHSSLTLPASIYEEKLAAVRDKIAPAAEQPVVRFMTRELVSVEASMPVETVVRNMIEARVHRVLVLDKDHHLQGIISTTDVLAQLLRG